MDIIINFIDFLLIIKMAIRFDYILCFIKVYLKG